MLLYCILAGLRAIYDILTTSCLDPIRLKPQLQTSWLKEANHISNSSTEKNLSIFKLPSHRNNNDKPTEQSALCPHSFTIQHKATFDVEKKSCSLWK